MNNTNNYLLITLGHNSSAIFVDNSDETQKIIGYEQERLSRLKSDSQFPIDAINEIRYNVNPDNIKNCKILISHWFNFTNNIPNKYITENDINLLKEISDDITFVDKDFTHHDAHAYSAYSFYKYNFNKTDNNEPVYCIIADGFGNNEEVFSVYKYNQKENIELVHRTFGYKNSIGLFYQYATSFVGMKENQDEYKFLGYEAHIDECLDKYKINKINLYINDLVDKFTKNLLNDTKEPSFDIDINNKNVINFDSLVEVKNNWYNKFQEILDCVKITNYGSFEARCAIAYYIQQSVEKILVNIVNKFNIVNLCVAGGSFYNVKTNNKLLETITGYFSAMPLAGDQGAAIGMYAKEEGIDNFSFETLCWGKRRFYNIKKLVNTMNNVLYYNKTDVDNNLNEIINIIANNIANGKIINLIYNNMEFGPRALCHTSSLFIPSTENVAHNNSMNKRNEVMPCAPVCTDKNAINLFTDDINRVIGSDYFMICTHNYNKKYSKYYGGVMHKKTLENIYTGRPQIITKEKNYLMYSILNKVEELTDIKCLVNTSFNAHGNPIVFDTYEILQNFKFQTEHAINKDCEPILVIINTEDK